MEKESPISKAWLLPGLYLASRVMVFFTIVVNGQDAFGDQNEYFASASLPGWPYFGYWVEYPPLFAFLNALIYRIAPGNRIMFFILFSIVLAMGGALALYYFQRIATRVFGSEQGMLRSVVLLALLIPLPYTWWAYDILPMLLLLIGIEALLSSADLRAGVSLGLGLLMKWFPGLALAAVLRYRPRKVLLRITLIAMGLLVLVWGILWLASPVMTQASLYSQPGRSSWQTVWAYLDGNRTTGFFIYYDWRLDPAQAYVLRGNPARFPSYLTLPVFVMIGLFLFWKVKNTGPRSLIAFVGITFALFLMWSPGWSPQWVIYLLPFILLTLDFHQGLVLSLTLLLICLFEWPVAINAGWYRAVFAMAGLRMLTLSLLIFLWYRRTQAASTQAIQ